MYGEVIKLSNSNISKQCKKGKINNYEGFDSSSEKMHLNKLLNFVIFQKIILHIMQNFVDMNGEVMKFTI